MGSVLQGDDGFGIEVIKELSSNSLPKDIETIEVGIGGISLVQELMSPSDFGMLIIVDAISRGGEWGEVKILEVDIPRLKEMPFPEQQEFLADIHYTTPTKVLILSKALGVLPRKTFIVGCEIENRDDVGIGLSEPVQKAVKEAGSTIKKMAKEYWNGTNG